MGDKPSATEKAAGGSLSSVTSVLSVVNVLGFGSPEGFRAVAGEEAGAEGVAEDAGEEPGGYCALFLPVLPGDGCCSLW
jgi:hypothetical protein